MKLLMGNDHNTTSLAPSEQLEQIILDSKELSGVFNRHRILGKVINRILLGAIKHLKVFSSNHQVGKFPGSQEGFFLVLIGPYFQKCLPHFLFGKSNSIYMFDAWPKAYDLIDAYLSLLDIRTVFFSSLQSTEAFKVRQPALTCVWVPEGIDIKRYVSRPYCEKDIDVIQFGRKYDRYHEAIVGALEGAEKLYLYEKVKGALVFPNREDFIDGIARAKISICVPSNITHPERSGNVSTMTWRYLESMAAKCLIVGILPEEMKLLFDYNPIVEIDMRDPANQILSILKDFDEYVPLIERNYRTLVEQHTWSRRWEQIRPYLLG
jgi:hypothetical protein